MGLFKKQHEREEQTPNRPCTDANAHWIYTDEALKNAEMRSVAAIIPPEDFVVYEHRLSAVYKYVHEGNTWTFLLAYEDDFPHLRNGGELPVKLYYIGCSAREIHEKLIASAYFPYLMVQGEKRYVYTPELRAFCESRALSPTENTSVGARSEETSETAEPAVTAEPTETVTEPCEEARPEEPTAGGYTEVAIRSVQGWVARVTEASLGNTEAWQTLHDDWEARRDLREAIERASGCAREDGDASRSATGKSKYTSAPHPRCRRVIFSTRAYMSVMSEAYHRFSTETGGVLIGHYVGDAWYVVEATDPGMHAVFSTAYHEGDEDYYNHLCPVLSRLYKHPLALLGMWHRHPGSFDRFSGTDDATNTEYARVVEYGSLSVLVNFDPDFRLTVYYTDIQSGRVRYYSPEVLVGDEHFGDVPYRDIVTPEELRERFEKSRRG